MKLPIGTYSFYNQLDNCPHKAFHTYVARTIPYVQTAEMRWGDQVHNAMENRIKHGSPLPDEMQAAEKIASTFYTMAQLIPVHTELKLAMTSTGQACDYEDKKNCWFRGKLDLVVMTTIKDSAWSTDWKTGNVREDPFELETGALLLKVNYPSLNLIVAEYFWMKPGQSGLRYTIKDHAAVYRRLLNLRTEAEGYLASMTDASGATWPKRKTPLCDWCPVKSCEHYTGKKVGK